MANSRLPSISSNRMAAKRRSKLSAPAMYAIRAWMAWSSTSDNFLMDATYGRTIRMQEQESAGAACLANYIGGIVPPDRRLPLRKSLILFLLLIFLPIGVGRPLLFARRRPRQLADGGSLQRRPAAARIGQSGCADPSV